MPRRASMPAEKAATDVVLVAGVVVAEAVVDEAAAAEFEVAADVAGAGSAVDVVAESQTVAVVAAGSEAAVAVARGWSGFLIEAH